MVQKPRTFKLITLRQLVHCTCRPNLAMNMEKENVTDRELFQSWFSYGSSICWRKQPDVPPANSWWRSLQIQRNLSEAGESVRLTSSECQAAWLPVRGACSRSYWTRNRRKHSAILAKDPIYGGTETWIKLSIKPEEINFNQSIIFLNI